MSFPRFPQILEWRCRSLAGHGILLAMLLAASLRAQDAGLEQVAPFPQSLGERQPRVGTPNDGFPYGFVDEKGKVTGFATELFDAVARVMDLRFQRELASGRDLHVRFVAGELDCLQTYAQAPEREEYADFTVPYLTLEAVVFVRKDAADLRSIADLNGKPFAFIARRGQGGDFLRARGAEVKPVFVSSAEEGLRLVSVGECAGVFVSRLTALAIIERTKLKNLQILPGSPQGVEFRHCFAVRKGDAQLLARLNEGLAIVFRSGEYDRIHRRWFGQFDHPLFTREQVFFYVAAALALALTATLWGLLRQRALRKRIAGQAAELAEKEALLQALYDNIPMAMCVLELGPGGAHRVLSTNRQAEAHFHVSPAQAAGRLLSELSLEPECAEHLAGMLNRWPETGGLVRDEHLFAATRKHLVLTLVPLAPGADGSARLCVLAEDVTERRQLDNEIAQSRKLRAVGELVGGIAHEFNNLLTPVMLKAGEIQSDWSEDAPLQQEVSVIVQAVQRAAELTRRLLTFGRRGENRAELVRLEAIVSSCFDLLRQTVDRRIVWESVVPADMPPLFINPTDLNQVLLNLLLNARDTLLDKLGDEREGWTPRITVEAVELPLDAVAPANTQKRQAVQGWQRLTVRDNGMGMAPEIRERIFEPFYTTKGVGKGTGLGLATVWHIVTEAGGRIEVESILGEGSAFHVTLPVLPGPERGRPVPEVRAVREVASLQVFVAEDEDLVAQTVSGALRRAGHEVELVMDGAAAWHHLHGNAKRFDLLILDVNMPGISGVELARRVRHIAHFEGKVMVISGRLTTEQLRAVGEARVDRVLPKPFTMKEFLAAVQECMEGPVLR